MAEYRTHLMVCAGTGCVSNGSYDVKTALDEEIKKKGLEHEVAVVTTGCNGFCAQGPIVVAQPDGIFYQLLDPKVIPRLVEEHLLKGRPVKELMYTPPADEVPVPKMKDIGFFKKQRLIALRNRGLIDPEKIDEYIGRDGYSALAKVLTEMKPEQVIKEAKSAGLRGRGGAGFPTGIKWERARAIESDIKYIICNADEGDPGAFMDRSIIESDPHSILEGMAIGAYAIGAREGFIYVRNEYPLALERLVIAIDQANEYGLLGERIFDTDFSFDVHVHRGAGAFVCGEETALIASIEGRLGNPRQRPPYPAESGLWGKPTNINNVETWSNVPAIMLHGAKWFSSIGTETSKGTKVFSLVGKINNTGLVEVPMGITLQEIIYDIGGGIPEGKKFKAVQTGGPSGGCIPAELMQLPIDFESLSEAGSMMGSGGMVVMDEDTCMVDVARYFLEFTASESCGKCTPCREGTKTMLQILTKITDGEGTPEDLVNLENVAKAVKETALCGLGQTAPNPVLTTLKYFPDEYRAHIYEKHCPAAVCKKIISSPCQHTCPIGTDVAAYVSLIAMGQMDRAAEVIRKDNPLPNVCARVCARPCEDKCQAGGFGDPVAIRNLKRVAMDYERKTGRTKAPPKKAKNGETVGIIGSGPAGLSAGFQLAQLGYGVKIYESAPVVGGMLGMAIPDYRLPKDILELDLDYIKRAGVEFQTDTTVGKDITWDELHSRHDAVFVAVGAHKNLKLGIPGEDAEGVLDVIRFLREVKTGARAKVGSVVGVIGGGDAAIDAARTAGRLGYEKVIILYRRTRFEMPADNDEIEEALHEDIEIHFLVAPKEVIVTDGKVTGLQCLRMELGDVDKSGRRRPVPIEGSEFTVELDTLIAAIGQEPDLSFIPEGSGIQISKWNSIEIDNSTFQTDVEKVFAGGDAVTGPATVVEAMAAGQIAAGSIHQFLRGKPVSREFSVTRPGITVEALELDPDVIPERRVEMQRISVADRSAKFTEVELGISEELAKKEAWRCLRCDLEAQR